MWPDRRWLDLIGADLLSDDILSQVGTMALVPQVVDVVDLPALAPLKAAAEAEGTADFSSLCSGQAAGLGREMGALELTRTLAEEALTWLGALGARI